MILSVPEELRTPSGFAYPAHQKSPPYEVWLSQWMERTKPTLKRVWLPVCFTEFYLRHGFRPHAAIQRVLDSLDPELSYATYVQSDDGILETVPDNVLVFASGGVGDIPVPLLSDPHLLPTPAPARDIWCSFIGKTTGFNDRTGVRSRMLKALEGKPGFTLVEATNDTARFEDLMARSVFALCPRGFGRSSFRMYEALQCGAIPIYVYDDLWLPYPQLNWRMLARLVHIDNVDWIPEMLSQITPDAIAVMQKHIAKVYPEWFTYESAARHIVSRINQGN